MFFYDIGLNYTIILSRYDRKDQTGIQADFRLGLGEIEGRDRGERRETDTQKQRDRETERQRDRETERQRDRDNI